MIEKLGNVFYRVDDMDAAERFYEQVLGLRLKFRDGDNWAAFDVGGATLALEGGSPGGDGGATVSLRVDGLDDLVGELQRQGAAVGQVVAGGDQRGGGGGGAPRETARGF